MKALLDAELLKMRSTRATALLVIATHGLVVLTVAHDRAGRAGGEPADLPRTTLTSWRSSWEAGSASPWC